MKSNNSNKDHAHQRGRGHVGADLPQTMKHKRAEGMEKSMPETGMGALESGYTDMGKITGHTKSHPSMKVPGRNNKNSRI